MDAIQAFPLELKAGLESTFASQPVIAALAVVGLFIFARFALSFLYVERTNERSLVAN